MERYIDKLTSNPPFVDMGIQQSESLPSGSNASWPTWKTLNWLRSGVGRTRANLIKWGYHTGDPSCNCGTETQTMEHLLQCPLLKTPCSRDDLSIFNDTAQKCVKLWQSTIENTIQTTPNICEQLILSDDTLYYKFEFEAT